MKELQLQLYPVGLCVAHTLQCIPGHYGGIQGPFVLYQISLTSKDKGLTVSVRFGVYCS